ncbi:hypothetical protein [Ruegeria atlantica]|uniref:hypothetical protein n=1 Tax=Ruegeria atlantica TaxID=81569 RepID=UPI001481B7BE|nr:hypothetical protein [Ruegeria atlantica]
MKPAFALSFSSTAISVHHQSDDDWFCIGEVALDAPDLNAQLHALRDKAFALENNLSCKLMLPTDQVRFVSTEADGQTSEESTRQMQAALAESTPYSIDELVFDTATVGTTIYLAAVTKQTLDEARDFASEHGFVPVQFAAESEPEDFPTEALFLAPEGPVSPSETSLETDANEATDPTPTAHPIADMTPPEAFRSAPEAGARAKASTDLPAKRYAIPAAVAFTVAVVLGVWVLSGSDDADQSIPQTAQTDDKPLAEDTQPDIVAEVLSEIEEPPLETTEVDAEAASSEPSLPDSTEAPQPELSPTDAAILEALNVAPTIVQEVTRDPEPQGLPPQTGISVSVPAPLAAPALHSEEEPYLASVDNSNLSNDAIALPPVESFDTDAPFEQVAPPGVAGTRFELDDRGLVTPSIEGTPNPSGVTIYLGRPSKVPPEPPVRFEQEPEPEGTSDRLAELRPKPRPSNLIERFERQQLGGRTLEELAVLRPKKRPESLQQKVIDYTPTALAVVRVPRPKPRPAGLAPSSGTQTANLGSTAAIVQDEAGSFQPKAVAPKIPSTASVARQATIDNALNLRKLNLIGVYGTPANRRALVRLPSGRYKKLKVGDRLDGGKVIAIGDTELRYQKKGRNVTLKMPRG